MKPLVVIASVVFAVAIGLLLYGMWLPSTTNPYHDAMGNGFLNEPILAQATAYKVAAGVCAAVAVFALLGGMALKRRA